MGYSSSAPSLLKTDFSGLMNSLGISRMMVLPVVHSGISCRRIHHLGGSSCFFIFLSDNDPALKVAELFPLNGFGVFCPLSHAWLRRIFQWHIKGGAVRRLKVALLTGRVMTRLCADQAARFQPWNRICRWSAKF